MRASLEYREIDHAEIVQGKHYLFLDLYLENHAGGATFYFDSKEELGKAIRTLERLYRELQGK